MSSFLSVSPSSLFRSALNSLIWWLMIRVWVRVRIWDRVRVTVRVIITVRDRVSKELGSGPVYGFIWGLVLDYR